MGGGAGDQTALPHVVVVGGGIAGLAAALAVREQSGGRVRVTVIEASPSVGGKLALTEVAGIAVDAGAESMLARRPEGLALTAAAGLADDVVHPAVAGASLWSRGRLRPLPSGTLMGLPGDLRSLAASHTLSRRGLARVPLDRVLRRTPVTGDVSIGSYVTARLGREVVDRLVEPLLGGVYAGHADEISLDAALPQLAGPVRTERSLLRSVETVLAAGAAGAPHPVFASIRGGLGRLPEAVAAASGADIRTGTTVREITRVPDGWRVVVGSTAAPETVHADGVVLALPAGPAARLLRQHAPYAADDLASVEYASVGLVTFALRALDVVDRLQGTGLLVPPVEGRVIKAATFSSAKWGWLHDVAGDLAIVRTSVGRHREVADLQRDDPDLAAIALADLADALGVGELHPVDAVVTRWGGALPQYPVGHLDRVARVRRALADLPALAVCGAGYDGVGIPACVASGRAAAARVVDSVVERREWVHG
jgi:oxygen-dependent protoporphyrinogen oxidase